MRETFTGLNEAALAAYNFGKDNKSISCYGYGSQGIPEKVFTFNVGKEQVSVFGTFQLLASCNQFGLDNSKLDLDSLSESINRIGLYQAKSSPVWFEVFEKVVLEKTEAKVEKEKKVVLDEDYLKQITPKQNNNKNAKNLLDDYAKTFNVELDKRKGFNKMLEELRKELS